MWKEVRNVQVSAFSFAEMSVQRAKEACVRRWRRASAAARFAIIRDTEARARVPLTTSLRIRLILIPSMLLLLGIVAAVAIEPYDATDRIDSEIRSGTTVGDKIIEYALAASGNASDPKAILQKLQQSLAQVRHISVRYRADSAEERIDFGGHVRARPVPQWFLKLFQPARLAKVYAVVFRGRQYGFGFLA